MNPFGDKLKAAREARELTLDEVHQATYIAQRYLEALERSDLEALPGRAFDTGYIRTYAEYLGIKAEPILKAYSRATQSIGLGTPESDQAMLEEFSRLAGRYAVGRGSRLHGPAKLLVRALVLVLFVSGAWWFGFRGASTPDEKESTASTALQTRDPSSAARKSSRSVDARDEDTVVSNLSPAPDAALEESGQASQTATVLSPSDSNPTVGGLVVREFGVGTRVVGLVLEGKSDSFLEGTRVRFLTRVVGGTEGEIVRHVWTHDGRIFMNAPLSIGGSHWRTYSSFELPSGTAGLWTAVARDAAGHELARVQFRCLEEPNSPH